MKNEMKTATAEFCENWSCGSCQRDFYEGEVYVMTRLRAGHDATPEEVPCCELCYFTMLGSECQYAKSQVSAMALCDALSLVLREVRKGRRT